MRRNAEKKKVKRMIGGYNHKPNFKDLLQIDTAVSLCKNNMPREATFLL